jgi:hypothetical protein
MRKAGINLSKELARMDFDSPLNPKNEPQMDADGRRWTQMDADGRRWNLILRDLRIIRR